MIAAPEEFIMAITEFIDDKLPKVIKQAIDFRKTSTSDFTLSIKKDFTDIKRDGQLIFLDDGLHIIAHNVHSWTRGPSRVSYVHGQPYCYTWDITLDYSDPKLFDHILLYLRRFYNGK